VFRALAEGLERDAAGRLIAVMFDDAWTLLNWLRRRADVAPSYHSQDADWDVGDIGASDGDALPDKGHGGDADGDECAECILSPGAVECSAGSGTRTSRVEER
jgi:hypothetical protein